MSKKECKHWQCRRLTLDNEDYCLYHKPNKNQKEVSDFYEGITEEAEAKKEQLKVKSRTYTRFRWTKQCNWQGFVFPEPPEGIGSFFRYSVFEQAVHCSNAKFNFTVHFKKSTFKDIAYFMNAKFSDSGMFDYAHFKGPSSFGGASFESTASFISAHFYDFASFENTQFTGKSNVGFGGAIFDDSARFDGAFFNRTGSFNNTVFNGNLSLDNLHFNQGVNGLAGNQSKTSAKISPSIFTNRISSEKLDNMAKFDDGTNEKDFGLFGKEKNDLLTELGCVESREGALTHRFNSEDKMKEVVKRVIEEIDFDRIAGLSLVEFKELEKFANPQAKAEGCREQRLTYESQGKKEEADQVFVHEMKARRHQREEAAKKKTGIKELSKIREATTEIFNLLKLKPLLAIKREKKPLEALRQTLSSIKENGILEWLETLFTLLWTYLEYPLADFTCLYGTSWGRVIGTSVGTMVAFPFIYWFGSSINVGGIAPIQGSETITSLGARFYYSVITFTTLGYGDLKPVGGYMQAWSAIESVLGAFFVALLVLVFGRKWVRR